MSTVQLSDTQLVLLSAASQHNDLAVEVPANLKGAAAHKVIGRLLKDGLLEEVASAGALPVWQRGDDGPFALRITQHGLSAIGAEEGVGAISAEEPKPALDTGARKRSPGSVARTGKARKAKAPKAEAKGPAKQKDGTSKQDTVIAMLGRREGATIDAIMEATGWQRHTVRGFFAAVIRKKLALNLVSEKLDGDRVYRIVEKGSESRSKEPTRKTA